MGKHTEVFNDTEVVIELKQGSANVFLSIHSLPSQKSYKIKVDESATYREYWCAVKPSPDNTTAAERVVFSSDDCAEFRKVSIYKDSNGKYTWKGTQRRGTWRNSPVEATTTSVPATPVSTEASTPVPATPVSTEASTPVPATPVLTEASTPVPTEVPTPRPTPAVLDAKTPSWWQRFTRFRKKN